MRFRDGPVLSRATYKTLPLRMKNFARQIGERTNATMIVTTTHSVEGKRIIRYCGIVTGEAILGANLFRDFFANIRDLVGGRSAAYENVLRSGRDTALQELEENARELGANAVVGVDIDYEVVGQSGGMLMVSVSGTAVVVE
jgi:uncharacterized protein YbjQ (UPF0145 family)